MKKIPLTAGRYALVDDDDYEELSNFTWSLDADSGRFYARHRIDGKTYLMHRIIMNARRGEHIRHADNDGLNNQKCNLIRGGPRNKPTLTWEDVYRIRTSNQTSRKLAVMFNVDQRQISHVKAHVHWQLPGIPGK